MKKIISLLLLLCAFYQNTIAQDKNMDAQAAAIPEANCSSVEALVSYIKQNFSTDSARIRAIYIWVANHITYDIARVLNRESLQNTPPQSAADVLNTRNAVCQGYTDLFVAICKGVDINAIAVSGYTKKDGNIAPLSHAWAAAMLANEWYLFDPTWGAGYVNSNHFIKKFNNSFYKMSPANFIADHMPFDPMYEFLSSPINHKEFIEGKQAATKTFFNYKDTLKLYNQFSPVQQNEAELRRLEAAGVQNELLQQRQLFLKNKLQSFASKNSFDEGAKTFNSAIAMYKDYIADKNKQFTTVKDSDLRAMVDSMENNVKLARSLVSEAIPKTDAQSQSKTNTIANMDRFWEQVDREKQFVAKYISADKEARKQLFMRR